MAWFRSVLAGLGCWAVWGGAQAAPLLLQAAQMKNLGIELQVPGGAAQGGSAVPARVIVPNAQMRVVAAPVAGLVEQLLVAPGSVVRKGDVVAALVQDKTADRYYWQRVNGWGGNVWVEELDGAEVLFDAGASR